MQRGMNGFRGWYLLRWQILERDDFTCQYCGQSAPDTRLEVDHKIPASDGGTDDPDNLVTACSACNQGKNAFILSYKLKKARANRALLNPVERTTAKILKLLYESENGLTRREIFLKLDLKLNTVKKSLYRLRVRGFISKHDGRWKVEKTY